MKVLSIQLRFCKLTLIAFFLTAPALQAQSSAAHVEAAPMSSTCAVVSVAFVLDMPTLPFTPVLCPICAHGLHFCRFLHLWHNEESVSY